MMNAAITFESKLEKSNMIKLSLINSYVRGFRIYVMSICMLMGLMFAIFLHDYFLIIFLVALFLFYFILISVTYSSKKNQNLYLTRQYVFSNENVAITSSLSQENLKWEVFTKWRKVGDNYLLYPSSIAAIVIPQNDIPAQQINDFENLLREKIKVR